MIFLFCLHDAPYYTGAPPPHHLQPFPPYGPRYLSAGLRSSLSFISLRCLFIFRPPLFLADQLRLYISNDSRHAGVGRILNFPDVISRAVSTIYIAVHKWIIKRIPYFAA